MLQCEFCSGRSSTSVTAMLPGARFTSILLACIFTLGRCSSATCKGCPKNQEIQCESLRSSHGYTYTVPQGILYENCEQGWYYQNGTFIVDSAPNGDGNRLPVVVGVTPHNLTVRVCENLRWELDCGECRCCINYTITDLKHSAAIDPLPRNNTTGDEKDGNDLPGWGIGLIIILGTVAVSAFIFFIGKRAKCFYKPNTAL
ncbi:uncharacterized protein LOC127950535 isoform X1 [Carassius gibelio]|uniref:uncharacterized protein LOC127950535 isoform X1 n=1 Tax=Carassius gibelio TaxID=101364 RepID=UPI002278AED2|nr:uncharacterized protein LOC127950535 isoform X1 [Carassius gibelio]